MRKDHRIPRGAVHRLTIESRVLEGNLLGDPGHVLVFHLVEQGLLLVIALLRHRNPVSGHANLLPMQNQFDPRARSTAEQATCARPIVKRDETAGSRAT